MPPKSTTPKTSGNGNEVSWLFSALKGPMVKIERQKEKFSSLISSERARTVIGKQGDHVTAYAIFQYCVYTAVEDKLDPEDAIKHMLLIMDQYTATPDVNDEDQIQKFFEEYKTTSLTTLKEAAFSSEEIRRILEGLQAIQVNEQDHKLYEKVEQVLPNISKWLLPKYHEHICLDFLEKLTQEHLIKRNRIKFTSFPPEHSVPAPDKEGKIIQQALTALKKVHEVTDKNLADIVHNIKQLFWYPPIPQKILLDTTKPEIMKQWEQERKAKGYNTDTLPRNNDIELLRHVMLNHIEMIFLCFPPLADKAYIEKIIADFVTLISAEWNDAGININKDELLNRVIESISVGLQDQFKSASSSGNSTEDIFPNPIDDFDRVTEDTTLAQQYPPEPEWVKQLIDYSKASDDSGVDWEEGYTEHEDHHDKKDDSPFSYGV